MAEPEVRVTSNSAAEESIDIEMQGGDSTDVIEVGETGAADELGEDESEALATEEDKAPLKITFVDYLKSPVISLRVGPPTAPTKLTAHRALLLQSPFFADAISPSSATPKTAIDLQSEDLEAVSCVLEYLYTGEYFPHKLPSGALQPDPSMPPMDTTGEQLLRHAKVYTLAEKLGMPALKTLSLSKIHLVSSTAQAELNYARYVYAHTPRSDTTIRRPVASFWGQRSHVLRHETEGSFREMCLEFPEFGFDVLSFVLDAEERREGRGSSAGGAGGSARKRGRN